MRMLPLPSCTVIQKPHSAEGPTLLLLSREQYFACSIQVSSFPWERVHVFPQTSPWQGWITAKRGAKAVFVKTHCRTAFPSRRSDLQGQGTELLMVKYCTLSREAREGRHKRVATPPRLALGGPSSPSMPRTASLAGPLFGPQTFLRSPGLSSWKVPW